MAGTRITIDIDDKAVNDALDRLIEAGGDLTPALDEMGAYIEQRTIERFDRGEGPGGIPWKPSYRASQGGQTLVNSGRLRGSITRQVTHDEVVVGTNVVYAAIHQFGGTIKPKTAKKLAFRIGGQLVFVDQVTIPARPFLGIDDTDEIELTAILADYVQDAVNRGASGSGGVSP